MNAEQLFKKYGDKALDVCAQCLKINEWYAEQFPILKDNATARVEHWKRVTDEVRKLTTTNKTT